MKKPFALVLITIFCTVMPYVVSASLSEADVLRIATTLGEMEATEADKTEALLETYIQGVISQDDKTFAILTEIFVNLNLAADSSKAKQTIARLNTITLTDWQEFFRDCAYVKIVSLDGSNLDALGRIDTLLNTLHKITNNSGNPMCRALKTGIEHDQGDLRAALLMAKADCLKELGQATQAKVIADQLIRDYPTSNWAIQAKAEYK